MSSDPQRTFHSSQALELTQIIQYKYASRRFGISPMRVLRIAALEGPSTDGGRKARQSVVLAPSDGVGANVIIGWIDAPARKAELRSYGYLTETLKKRRSVSFDVDVGNYEALIDELSMLLRNNNVQVKVASTMSALDNDGPTINRAGRASAGRSAPSGYSSGPSPSPSSGGRRLDVSPQLFVGLAIGFVLGLGAGIALF